jgi:hypothetical protein
MKKRRRWRMFAACAFFVSAAAGCVLAWAQFHGGPPWRHAVTSSQTFRIDGATVQVDFGPGTPDLPKAAILGWVENAASSVATYYGRFPVAKDRVLIEFASGQGILRGTSWGDVGGLPAFHRLVLGERTTQADLDDDWEMTHEFVHSAFPSMDEDHSWIEEGQATYIEPVARVQRGFLRPERIWSDMMRDMPKGDPGSLDHGLDETHTWGRTYWGGAQFCLLADVMIREQTHNKKGLQDALRAVVDAGGTIDKEWPIEKALEMGDRATGTHVLMALYSSMKDAPKPVDLTELWRKLGVVRVGDGVRFDDHALEADIRKAITRAPASGLVLVQP